MTEWLRNGLLKDRATLTKVFWPKKIEMDDNVETQLCNALKDNNTAERIHFDLSPRLSTMSCLKLASALIAHPKIQFIAFEAGTVNDFGPFANAIWQSASLQAVSFNKCKLSPSIVQGIRFLLEQNTIEELYIRDCKTNDDHNLSLDGCLEENNSLKKTDISFGYTRFDLGVARELSRLLSFSTLLQEVCVCLTSEIPVNTHADLVANIFDGAAESQSLQVLTVNDEDEQEQHLCGKGTIGRSLANLIRNSPCLKRLDLSLSYSMDPESNSQIARAMSHNSILEKLTLGCGMESASFIAIINALRSNSALRNLKAHVSDNNGAVALSEMLAVNTSLEHLEIASISDESLQSFSSMLPKIRCLRTLECSSSREENSFRKDTLDLLEHGLKQNTSLERVSVEPMSNFMEQKESLNYCKLLNCGGRRILGSERDVPRSVWSRVLARSSDKPDVLYFFLRERPDIFNTQSASRRNTRKRKHCQMALGLEPVGVPRAVRPHIMEKSTSDEPDVLYSSENAGEQEASSHYSESPVFAERERGEMWCTIC